MHCLTLFDANKHTIDFKSVAVSPQESSCNHVTGIEWVSHGIFQRDVQWVRPQDDS